MTSAFASLISFQFFKECACHRVLLLLLKVSLHLVSIDRHSVEASNEIVILCLLLVVYDHGLDLG
jgi:hypothetical protein